MSIKPAFLVAVRRLDLSDDRNLVAPPTGRLVWQVGYVVNTDGTTTSDRSLSSDEYRAAAGGLDYLRSVSAATQTDHDLPGSGVRVTRC